MQTSEGSRHALPVADEPGAVSLGETLQHLGDDEQEEWEYEYSTTEQETYYLTLELSYPEFRGVSTQVHHSRGGYYKNWLDQPHGRLHEAATTAPPRENEVNDDEDDEPAPEPVDDIMQNVDPALRDEAPNMEKEDDPPNTGVDDEPGTEREDDIMRNVDPALLHGGKEVDREDEPPEVVPPDIEPSDIQQEPREEKKKNTEEPKEYIQVLELHSDKPIISYRGRVFEGQWAEVLGTEIILTNHDAANPQPALRNLSEGVDLLAASSSRILTTEKVLKPKVPDVDTLAPIREEWNIRIPSGKDKTGERKQQTRFLENLIALKKKKGEEDLVTVYTREGAGKDFKDNKGPDYKPRRRRATPGNGVSARGRRRTGRPGRPPGRRRGRGRGYLGGERAATESVTSPLSTPTPRRWDELSRDHYDDEESDGGAEGADGSADDENDDEDVEDVEDEDGSESDGDDEEEDEEEEEEDVAMAD